jgi:transposase
MIHCLQKQECLTMAGEFWLDDDQWAVISPLLPTNQPGAHRTDDRRVISGIIHVLRSGCRWQDCPSCYGPSTTVYNRFHRWSARGIWRRLFEALVQTSDRDIHMIDSTTAKAHRSAAGGKGGRMAKQSVDREAADRQKSMLLSMVAAVQLRCE